jgi:RNA polymerase sigma factor (sigma-70 family)
MSQALRTYADAGPVEANAVSEGRRAMEQRFERVLREHGAALTRLASGYEANAGMREELVQEIALAIWQALPNFRGESSERTFVFRIAHNRALTHVWKRRPAHAPLDEIEESQQPVDPRARPEDAAAQRSQRERLMVAIHSLPLTHRQIITLMLEDFSYAEMAEVLGISENNVAVRLNRAKQALKQALGVNAASGAQR